MKQQPLTNLHSKSLSKLVTIPLSCALISFSSHVSAVGLMILPPSQITGMANAGSAVYDKSVVSISINPAAMSLMSEKQLGANLTLVIPDYEPNEKWDCDDNDSCAESDIGDLAAIPTIGLIRPMDNNFTWGIGFGALSGSGLDYGNSWSGRGLVIDNHVAVMELMNSVSWRMDDQWTFGGGVGVLYGEFEQKQDLPTIGEGDIENVGELMDLVGELQGCSQLPAPQRPACVTTSIAASSFDPAQFAGLQANMESYTNGETGTTQQLDGDDTGVKLSLGLTYQPNENHRFGAVYHWLTDFTFEGTAEIKGELLSDETYQKNHMTMGWDMPSRFILSGFHRVSDKLDFYWDFERVFYNAFEGNDLRVDHYEALTIDRNFKNANRYAVGAEYHRNDQWSYQFGLSFDESPVEDDDRLADIPVDEITKISTGATYQASKDLSYHGYFMIELLGDGNVEQLASVDGHKIGDSVQLDYDTTLYVLGASLSYKF